MHAMMANFILKLFQLLAIMKWFIWTPVASIFGPIR